MDGGNNNSDASAFAEYQFALGDELRGERATLGKSLLDVQRDLRIQAAYIAAIEDVDPSVFPNKAFISGYIRSYSRYLNLNPDEVYARFCHESGFSSATAKAKPTKPTKHARTPGTDASGSFTPNFPMAQKSGPGLRDIPVSGIGSLLVLAALVGGLGYGGWTVLENIQRVQFAPIEETPIAVAEIETLSPPVTFGIEEPEMQDLASPVAATDLAELYRHQELEVPILVPRDGPIAAIDPDRTARLTAQRENSSARFGARPAGSDVAVAPVESAEASPAVLIEAAIAAAEETRAVAADVPVSVVAERAAWVRVYLENGTIIFEQILGEGETYNLPQGVRSPMIWAGNSGSVYVRVGEDLHGPLGSGTKAVRDVVLEPAAISGRFAQVKQVPRVLSQTMGVSVPVTPGIAIR